MEAGYLAGSKAAEDLLKIFKERGIEPKSMPNRDAYRNALDGKMLAFILESENADFDPEMIRRKLKLPDSLRFNRQKLEGIINDIYATDIYKAVIPSIDQLGNAITLTLQEEPDIRTRGRVEISSTSGLTLFTRTDLPMSRFGGLVQFDVAFGNISGGGQLAVYPVSYHKTGARMPFSIRPAIEARTSYYNYDLPATVPLADRIQSHELSIHSASIGGWNRQMLLYGGLRSDDPGQIRSARSDFDFPEQFDQAMPFIRLVYKEDHIKRDLPNVEGWKIGFQSDWIWQDAIVSNQNHLWTTLGGRLASSWSGTLSLELYSGSGTLPLAMMGQVMSPRALSEKYYMYTWADKVLNLSLETSHTLLREDLLGELKMSHSRFQHPLWSGLDAYENRGLSALDISINLLTIVGKLSVGWSFSELEDYKGTSWTQIGITL